ncbi:acyl-CoA dehydrogenase family protein [Sphingobium sp. TKS]|uniref:acyl-CoA dehydrogenase family protein n=1 Tax=Sphingobium sp. TKS TaxID=1315974 RepID=UPI00077040EB|nr:acyl-CoA dehydrogenase family protein [Sphingobium sp. TKS]AMK25618.1 acyl-CoA dehydrogenase-like protein [Sphingobium sp. TKS]
MDLSFSDEHRCYRADLRTFLATHWTPSDARDSGKVAAFRALATQHGYLYRGIPKKFGGSEQPVDILRAQIIAEEFNRARAPKEVSGNGMSMLVPVLLELGTDWQKEHFIPQTLTGAFEWAQGYSEPGSGSDLASLRTTGELVDGHWIINGQKIWTTRAHQSNYMFCLVRTEPGAPKHQGLSYILLDFRQPGITVRPLRQISGESEFSEVFLDNVRAPADWIVGERGKGWEVSRVNLKHERASVGSASRATHLQHNLLKIARQTMVNGRPAIEDPIIRDKLAILDGYVQAQICASHYQTTLAVSGESTGVLGLSNKLNNTNIAQLVSQIASDILGDALLPMPAETGPAGPEKWNRQIMGSLGLSIAGGTSNIQRNIIAERGLGLPRE